MRYEIRGRQTGKTTELVKMSAKKDIPILCPNQNSAIRIKVIAKELMLNIPEPITVHDFKLDCRQRGYLDLLIDDAMQVLHGLISCNIEYAMVEDDSNVIGCNNSVIKQ